MELFKIVGKIAVDAAEAIKQITQTSDAAKDMADDIGDAASEGEKSSGKLGSALKKLGSGALAVGKTVATGMAVAGTALAGLTAKAISAAGELEQNVGGAEAVFKDLGGSLDEMSMKVTTYDSATGKMVESTSNLEEVSKNAFKNMGLSQSDYLATANKMGSLFKGAGFETQEALDMSSQAMQRAADVASIMGIDTASAMEAVAGAAKGNFTMMDNLGVAMNDTTLQAYALEKGMIASGEEMTSQQKIAVAMEMFLDKTSYAAGQYAKENETLAGSLGTAKSALTNFLSGAGTVEDVVSSFSNAANVIVKNIETMFPSLMNGITQLVSQLTPMIPPLLEQVLPGLISGATSLIDGLVSALPQLLSVLTESVLPQLLTGIVTIANSLISALPSVVQSICSALPTLIPLLVSGLVSMIVTLCSNFSAIIQPIIDILPDLIVLTVNTLLSNLPALIMGVGQLIVGLARALPQILSGLWTALTTLCKQAASGLFNKIGEWIRQLFPKSADNIFKVLDTIKSAFQTWIENIKAIFSVVVSVISTPFKLAWNGVKLVWDNCVAFFRLIWNNIKAIFSVVDSVLSGDFRGAWNGIKQIWSNCVGFFKNIVSNVKNAFSNVGEILTAPFRKGRDAIKKIVDNIKGFFTGLKLNFPKIKLPHFKVKPSGWEIGDLLKGSIPKLSIDWYARAMNQPIIMTKPTVFGYNGATGELMGGGEAGSEVVSGTNTLMTMIQNAVANQVNGLAYYLQLVIDILSDYFPQLLESMDRDVVLDSGEVVGALAVPMNRALGKLSMRKDRGR